MAEYSGRVLAALAVAAGTVARTRRAGDAALLAMVAAMHLAYGLGEWAEALRPGRDFSERGRGG